MSERSIIYFEIDIDRCALTYSESPCTAALSVTGDHKCFNTRLTCQDPANYDNTKETIRFAVDAAYLPKEITAIPSIADWSISPAIISLGENIGLRAELRVTLRDHPWPDTGPGGDKYIADRAYDPFTQGTFWGKLRARLLYLQGAPARLRRGFLGQTLEQMDTRHFIVEVADGPTPRGTVDIVCKDPLKAFDGDRAIAPTPSNGFLVSEIDDIAGSLTVAPSGIGNAEYPSSGWIAIGGSEICSFTRSGDTFTLTNRGQFGTEAQDHAAEDRVQLCLFFQGQDPANIISNLAQNYAGTPSEFIPIGNWLTETSNKLRRVYTALIAEPTPVKQLVDELIEQAALSLWWDDLSQTIQLRVLGPVPLSADEIGPNIIQEGSFGSREQENKRVTRVWVYYALINPLDSVTDPQNYRSAVKVIDADVEGKLGRQASKTIYSRWIPAFGRLIALRLADIQIGRFRNPPRRFNFDLFRGSFPVVAGQGYRIGYHNLQDIFGAPASVPLQVTRVNPGAAILGVEAEEFEFAQLDPEDLENRVIIIEADTLNFNLRSAHDNLYPAPDDPDAIAPQTITCIIESGVGVGATNASTPAFTVGDWPGGLDITIRNAGTIIGRGGNGGNGWNGAAEPATNGGPGGPGLYSRYNVTVENNGVIAGGGGGGGGGGVDFYETPGGGGGGGAGFQFGTGGTRAGGPSGHPGTRTAGGNGGPGFVGAANGGRGGNPGQAGATGTSGGFGTGGAAGVAVDGDSFITFTPTGTIQGARIN